MVQEIVEDLFQQQTRDKNMKRNNNFSPSQELENLSRRQTIETPLTSWMRLLLKLLQKKKYSLILMILMRILRSSDQSYLLTNTKTS